MGFRWGFRRCSTFRSLQAMRRYAKDLYVSCHGTYQAESLFEPAFLLEAPRESDGCPGQLVLKED
jgi:hypothetical protein